MNKVRWMLPVLGIVLRLVVAAQQPGCDITVSGTILDLETKEPIPFVSVRLENKAVGAVSDEKGRFQINGLCDEEFELIISCVGYKTTRHHHDSYHAVPTIYLAEDDRMLESVIVEGEQVTSELKTLDITQLSAREFAASRSESLGDVAGKITGLSTISTGQNVVKPMIHGLHSNRVLIVNNGVRHEFQNWGTGHAPEIDPSLAESLEVVKGAATVRYGPDALGGVLLINPPQLQLHSRFQGHVELTGNTNGRSGEVNGGFQQGWKHWVFSGQGSLLKQGDLHAPDYQLTNTGKEEHSYSGAVRYHLGKLDFEGYYSHFSQILGILRGSVNGNLEDLATAMDSDIPPETQSFSYTINNPHQEVSHDLYRLKGTYFLDNQDFSLQYAYQVNHRQEYDIRRGTNNEIPSINLDLATQSVDFDWNHPDLGAFSGSAGMQWLYQDGNNIPGTNTIPFIPNYNNSRLGIYWIEQLTVGTSLYEAGVRYDYQKMSVRGREEDNDIYRNELTFSQMTGSLGWRKNVSASLAFRSNLGMAWRPPSVSELYSFGKHEASIEYGLWRYEYDEDGNISVSDVLDENDRKVKSEMGLKWINTLEKTAGDIHWEITPYANYIRHYIYNKPAGITNTVRGAFPYFVYDQTDALFVGADAVLKRQIMPHLEGEGQISYVWVRDVKNDDNFVEIPPLNLAGKLTCDRTPSFLASSAVSLDLSYTFRYFQQPRVIAPREIIEAEAAGTDLFAEDASNFDFMEAPDGYLLTNVTWTAGKGAWEWTFTVKNVFDVRYRNYMNRLRYFADETGRNFRLSVRYLIR